MLSLPIGIESCRRLSAQAQASPAPPGARQGIRQGARQPQLTATIAAWRPQLLLLATCVVLSLAVACPRAPADGRAMTASAASGPDTTLMPGPAYLSVKAIRALLGCPSPSSPSAEVSAFAHESAPRQKLGTAGSPRQLLRQLLGVTVAGSVIWLLSSLGSMCGVADNPARSPILTSRLSHCQAIVVGHAVEDPRLTPLSTELPQSSPGTSMLTRCHSSPVRQTSSRALPLLLLLLAVTSKCPSATALPSGCSMSGTVLVSCTGFSGATLGLSSQGITSIRAGAFSGMTGLRSLDLQSNQLSSLPAGIFDSLTGLIALVLIRNQLSSLSGDIFDNLTSLQALFLAENQLTSLTPGIFDSLTPLKWLDLARNQLTTLPPGIFDSLTSLTTLYLNRNELSSLRADIFDSLTDLTTLHMSVNQLSSISSGTFDSLTSLTFLDLTSNQLSSLPAGLLDSLTSLTQLFLMTNQLSSLPPGIFDRLSSLGTLILGSNQLRSLPAGIFDSLTSLSWLDLFANAFPSPCSASGFESASRLGQSYCTHPNPCANHNCPDDSTCIATQDGFSCRCDAGLYLSSDSPPTCTMCPAGHYAAEGATQCTACPTGETSEAGSTTCSLCVAPQPCAVTTEVVATLDLQGVTVQEFDDPDVRHAFLTTASEALSLSKSDVVILDVVTASSRRLRSLAGSGVEVSLGFTVNIESVDALTTLAFISSFNAAAGTQASGVTVVKVERSQGMSTILIAVAVVTVVVLAVAVSGVVYCCCVRNKAQKRRVKPSAAYEH